ncbi:MAG: hypothetical protein H6581_08085 [Bacteroidia bacterium]|nr:hypothetical protein [Bacteroidia bacterium]
MIKVLGLILLVFAGTLQAQSPVCAGESFCITLGTHRGDIQWQSSTDQVNWTSMGGATHDTLCTVASASTWFRAEVTEGDCNPIFSDTVYVEVIPTPSADAGADQAGCEGSQVQLGGNPAVSGGSGTYTVAWTPATGLSSTTANNPMATLSSNMTYTFTVTDSNGCTSSDMVDVTANPLPVADAGLDTSGCPPDTAVLGGNPAASGGTGPYTYSWSPANNLSSTSVANPTVVYSGLTYTLSVTDANGCVGTDSVDVSFSGGGGGSGTQTFAYTGGVQFFVVPPCVDTILVEAWGAQGGTATNNNSCILGGLGGYAYGQIVAYGGDTLWLYVGGAGQPGDVGGWNGGGTACLFTTTCARGGGASDLRYNGTTLNDRLLVAGGGGGAEYSGCAGLGGAGGGLIGGSGTATAGGGAYNATGGTQTAGGFSTSGAGGYVGGAGTFGIGGASGTHPNGHAGSGGGGWYGGGGSGADGHAGGGSSYIDGMIGNKGTTAGLRTGNGQITLTW